SGTPSAPVVQAVMVGGKSRMAWCSVRLPEHGGRRVFRLPRAWDEARTGTGPGPWDDHGSPPRRAGERLGPVRTIMTAGGTVSTRQDLAWWQKLLVFLKLWRPAHRTRHHEVKDMERP